VSADRNREKIRLSGTIAMDAAFSPVRKVNFVVSSARVGQRTDYDKLSIEVWTDGSLRPDDAVAVRARILQDQVSVLINFDVEEIESQETARSLRASRSTRTFPLRRRARSVGSLGNCLQNATSSTSASCAEDRVGNAPRLRRKFAAGDQELLARWGFVARLARLSRSETLDRMRLEQTVTERAARTRRMQRFR